MENDDLEVNMEKYILVSNWKPGPPKRHHLLWVAVSSKYFDICHQLLNPCNCHQQTWKKLTDCCDWYEEWKGANTWQNLHRSERSKQATLAQHQSRLSVVVGCQVHPHHFSLNFKKICRSKFSRKRPCHTKTSTRSCFDMYQVALPDVF